MSGRLEQDVELRKERTSENENVVVVGVAPDQQFKDFERRREQFYYYEFTHLEKKCFFLTASTKGELLAELKDHLQKHELVDRLFILLHGVQGKWVFQDGLCDPFFEDLIPFMKRGKDLFINFTNVACFAHQWHRSLNAELLFRNV